MELLSSELSSTYITIIWCVWQCLIITSIKINFLYENLMTSLLNICLIILYILCFLMKTWWLEPGIKLGHRPTCLKRGWSQTNKASRFPRVRSKVYRTQSYTCSAKRLLLQLKPVTFRSQRSNLRHSPKLKYSSHYYILNLQKQKMSDQKQRTIPSLSRKYDRNKSWIIPCYTSLIHVLSNT